MWMLMRRQVQGETGTVATAMLNSTVEDRRLRKHGPGRTVVFI